MDERMNKESVMFWQFFGLYLNDELINKMYLKCGIYVYNEILFSLKEEESFDTRYNMMNLEDIILSEISQSKRTHILGSKIQRDRK